MPRHRKDTSKLRPTRIPCISFLNFKNNSDGIKLMLYRSSHEVGSSPFTPGSIFIESKLKKKRITQKLTNPFLAYSHKVHTKLGHHNLATKKWSKQILVFLKKIKKDQSCRIEWVSCMKHQTHNSMPNLVLFLSKALILEEVLEEHDT